MTIAMIGTMQFPPQAMEALRPHILQLVEQTRANDGCISYDVAEDLFTPGLLRFSEVWPDMASLERHFTAPHIAPWREACAANGIGERKFTAFEMGEPLLEL